MFIFILSIIIIALTQGFILLEEELIIILASIIWVDAAGTLIKNLLTNEVDYKSNLIKEKYLWFLYKKKELQNTLIIMYSKRVIMYTWLQEFKSYILVLLILNSVVYFLNNLFLLRCFVSIINLINIGIVVVKQVISTKTLGMIQVLKENDLFLNPYITTKYLLNLVGTLKIKNLI